MHALDEARRDEMRTHHRYVVREEVAPRVGWQEKHPSARHSITAFFLGQTQLLVRLDRFPPKCVVGVAFHASVHW